MPKKHHTRADQPTKTEQISDKKGLVVVVVLAVVVVLVVLSGQT